MNHFVRVKKWLENDKLEPDLKNQIKRLSESELKDSFGDELAFGTAGIRGIIGVGTNRLNIYTLRKANIGFAKYLLNNDDKAQERGVVIAHDNRHFSKEFALESAKVLATFGIKTYLFDALRPTPLLSFSVRHLNAVGGIVITASHNPPQYNGYKIYDQYGCQFVPEMADEVKRYTDEIDDIFSFEVIDDENLTHYVNVIGCEVDTEYLEKVKSIQLNPGIEKNIKIVFTPLHGTSAILGMRILKECNYDVYPVLAQMEPDPDFSTVKFPNPEDKDAFNLAIDLGKKVDGDILIATDPDADRVGVAVKDINGEYILLTGNQTGAILIKYLLSQLKEKNKLPKKGIIYNTVVTSDLGELIAESYGVSVFKTLTGFKYIGEQARLIENTDHEFLFGYEESYGYVIKDFVRDKDSIQALLLIAEAAAYYHNKGKTLYNVLEDIYEEYAYILDTTFSLAYEGIEGKEKIDKIMDYFRNHNITKIADLPICTRSDYLRQKAYGKFNLDLKLPKANVMKFHLCNESWFVLRPSGTEPKIKIYVSVKSDSLVNANALIKGIYDDIYKIIEKI